MNCFVHIDGMVLGHNPPPPPGHVPPGHLTLDT